MKCRVVCMNDTGNHANDRIVRIIGVVMTICGAAQLARRLSPEMRPCMLIPALKPRAANAQILRNLPLHIARWHLAHTYATHRRNGRSVTVRINDRDPFMRGRVIDLTPAGARALGFSGLAPVKLELAQN